jgi:membrane protein implicated in regulation of membrane protease activity
VNERLTAKLVIAAVGVAVFMTGVRLELPIVRWIGIGLVAVAFLLRFVGPRSAPRTDQRSGAPPGGTAPKSGP